MTDDLTRVVPPAGRRLELVGRSTLSEPAELVSEVIPLSFRIVSGQQRAEILITHAETAQQWHV
ncbi:MAG: hypothetical protein KY476_05800 [Planctomycetes bacterium]|nr:hypothetical protein [Planctomycetota bacterium]